MAQQRASGSGVNCPWATGATRQSSISPETGRKIAITLRPLVVWGGGGEGGAGQNELSTDKIDLIVEKKFMLIEHYAILCILANKSQLKTILKD